MIRNESFLEKASALEPRLIVTKVPAALEVPAVLGEGDRLRLDFGNHYVGHLRLKLSFMGSHPDAPLWLRIRFAEREREFSEDPKTYRGWISKGWIQSEEVHIDVLPSELTLPRRYAFRYVQIEVLAASSKYQAVLDEAVCLSESSAKDEDLRPYEINDPFLAAMDRVAVRTLHECMQKVFEDGPKRDRRLWLGDLRLQALANYQTYRDLDLVKRCLYLFAGDTFDDGSLSGAVFVEPEIEADDVSMFDYALLFIAALRDYYRESGDGETLRDLWPIALQQIEAAKKQFDANGLVKDSDRLGWCFLDWNLALNKQAGAQGVYLYSLKAAIELAKAQDDSVLAGRLRVDYAEKKAAALRYLWDEESRFFVSGAERQCSLASQVWMILGGVLEGEDARALLAKAMENDSNLLAPVTPYMMHHLAEAAILCGEKEKALQVLKDYWGGMISEGADTFWELYDPKDPEASPYGGSIVNSYCHAWSCAPAYFLRKYY